MTTRLFANNAAFRAATCESENSRGESSEFSNLCNLSARQLPRSDEAPITHPRNSVLPVSLTERFTRRAGNSGLRTRKPPLPLSLIRLVARQPSGNKRLVNLLATLDSRAGGSWPPFFLPFGRIPLANRGNTGGRTSFPRFCRRGGTMRNSAWRRSSDRRPCGSSSSALIRDGFF